MKINLTIKVASLAGAIVFAVALLAGCNKGQNADSAASQATAADTAMPAADSTAPAADTTMPDTSTANTMPADAAMPATTMGNANDPGSMSNPTMENGAAGEDANRMPTTMPAPTDPDNSQTGADKNTTPPTP